MISRVQLFVTLWTVACQDPLSMGLSRQEHWSELLCPPPRDLHDPGIKLTYVQKFVSSKNGKIKINQHKDYTCIII